MAHTASTSTQKISVLWNNHANFIAEAFDRFRYTEHLTDVTLCCEGRKIRAHKMLLSACSPYFKEVFKENPCQHPVIIFNNVRHSDLMSILDFVYSGETIVEEDQLASFHQTAELLSIQTLSNGFDKPQTQQQETRTSVSNTLPVLQGETAVLDTPTTITIEDSPRRTVSNTNIIDQQTDVPISLAQQQTIRKRLRQQQTLPKRQIPQRSKPTAQMKAAVVNEEDESVVQLKKVKLQRSVTSQSAADTEPINTTYDRMFVDPDVTRIYLLRPTKKSPGI